MCVKHVCVGVCVYDTHAARVDRGREWRAYFIMDGDIRLQVSGGYSPLRRLACSYLKTRTNVEWCPVPAYCAAAGGRRLLQNGTNEPGPLAH